MAVLLRKVQRNAADEFCSNFFAEAASSFISLQCASSLAQGIQVLEAALLFRDISAISEKGRQFDKCGEPQCATDK